MLPAAPASWRECAAPEQEFDFLREARLMRVIAARLAAAGVCGVVVPEPLLALSTPRMLVMQRMLGGGPCHASTLPALRCCLCCQFIGAQGLCCTRSPNRKLRKLTTIVAAARQLLCPLTVDLQMRIGCSAAGVPLSRILERPIDAPLRARLRTAMVSLLDALGCSMLRHGLFQADPHAGNLLLQVRHLLPCRHHPTAGARRLFMITSHACEQHWI